jgi:hypothetical protein
MSNCGADNIPIPKSSQQILIGSNVDFGPEVLRICDARQKPQRRGESRETGRELIEFLVVV